ncbi:hypothetical protein [Kitasatospora purpeofusca]|uniref:hypothetical protein n=1 Tax=Kitasatospora purpeofusca TaxID=67352 RepID=UPI0036D3FECE
MNGLARVQDEVKDVGHVIGQALGHAATVADQQLWVSSNSGQSDRLSAPKTSGALAVVPGRRKSATPTFHS